jgi:uncharacterized protein YjbI with pentapeptide repeats
LTGRWAGLSRANLAELVKADLSKANLFDARVSEGHLTQVKSLEGATMPDGTVHR